MGVIQRRRVDEPDVLEEPDQIRICGNCGEVWDYHWPAPCPRCGSETWIWADRIDQRPVTATVQ